MLREEKTLPLRTVAAYLDIDQAILSKIERGQRNASRELVPKLAGFFKTDENELMVLWLSENIYNKVSDEELALKAIKVAEDRILYKTFHSKGRKEIINKIKETLKKFSSVKMAWIFGSFARLEENNLSDIDLLIDVPVEEEFTLFDISEIQYQLQEIIKRKVDIVMLSAIKPSIRNRINNEMFLIYEARKAR